MRRLALLLIAVPALALTLLPEPASAAPFFARRYGFDCTMCHAGFPRLNDFGVRFRAHGYRLPGREIMEQSILTGTAPIAARTLGGYEYEKLSTAGQPELNQFRVLGIDLLAGGVLGPRAGFFGALVPAIEESRDMAGQTGVVESASVVFLLAPGDLLNLRAGRFEPEAIPFSVRRQLSLSPYEIYEVAFPGGVIFGENQAGVELTSRTRAGLRAAAGWLDGGPTNGGQDAPGDGYLRLAWVIGPGEGQTAGQRIGVTGYVGQARRIETDGEVEIVGLRQSFYRLGADASLNRGGFNLALQWLLERADHQLWGTATDADITGGFAELTWLPTDRLVAFGRYDLVRMPDEIKALDEPSLQDAARYTGGVRLYLESSLALHAEYSHRAQTSAPAGQEKQKTDFAALVLDWAF